MPNQLDLPEDLQHLIEKREDGDRRESDATARGGETPTERRGSGRRADDGRRGARETG